MNPYESVKVVVNKLHKINFSEIIKYDDFDESKPNEFQFDAKQERFKEHVTGYCEKCSRDAYKPYYENTEKGFYKLNNISHGTHTFDFLHAFGLDDKNIIECFENGWSDEPVLFLMENPSVGSETYDYLPKDDNKTGKRAVKNWYWIHYSLEENYKNGYYDNERYLVQSQYGNMVAALINQFKLGNAYLTNTVKCGISDARIVDGRLVETGYKNLDEYTKECKCTCIKNILVEEIKALCDSEQGLRPLRIFAFGERPYWIMKDLLKYHGVGLKLEYQLYQLPHPASREKNSFRKYILRGAIKESFENKTFEIAGNSEQNVNTEEAVRVFRNAYSGIALGKRCTKNQCFLGINEYDSIFSDKRIVSEIWIKGKPTDTTPFTWGIGYVFESDDYWYWNYNNNEYVQEQDIPHSDRFKKAINELRNNIS